MAASSSPLMSSSFRPSEISGRSRGVPFSLVFERLPCKSGTPHDVRGGVHFLAGAGVGDFRVCAEAGIPTSTNAINTPSTAIGRKDRWLIETSLRSCPLCFGQNHSETQGSRTDAEYADSIHQAMRC